MPGWHAATKELQDSGKLEMIGIIQEQNPERARLFMQWQQMEWPIMVDTFDLLEVSVVPLTYAIDERGIVRFAGLRTNAAATIEHDFVSAHWPAPNAPTVGPSQTSEAALATAALGDRSALERAMTTYTERINTESDDGWAHFRLAAAHRLRYDSDDRQPGDFQEAINHWRRALEIDPNNYIWRRRIQQYGPRLAKPYPFYDWIEKAQAEIRVRGEEPVPLTVEPTEAEIAQPEGQGNDSTATDKPHERPMPSSRIIADGLGEATGRLIQIEQTAVPRRLGVGETSRVHLVFRPNQDKLAHWNNESEPLRLWIELPEGWRASSLFLETPNPADTAVSTETRAVEFEIQAPDSMIPGESRPKVIALYYVCEDENGTCLFRRQDIHLDFELRQD